ncbi:CLUMA_CG016674, isoform A [Clunio marinus]|uniref:CLUMA_CG016674, isoform A n=1 Tax=Clunio marinus TaxID=568069 RepID=A0A1J1IVE6_9DIPT|nr:CLUMA_CG016674, isoform A [Clunio marinus]
MKVCWNEHLEVNEASIRVKALLALLPLREKLRVSRMENSNFEVKIWVFSLFTINYNVDMEKNSVECLHDDQQSTDVVLEYCWVHWLHFNALSIGTQGNSNFKE